jgi:glucose-1-phosphate thymidylyltransferase
MRGILLAGGTGSRLWPITKAVSKQLMPVYDKPMVYYPLTTLLSAGVRDILVITTPEDQPQFRRLLGTGEDLGISLQYLAQPRPEGIAQAFVIGADFIAEDSAVLILGDNIFHGADLGRQLRASSDRTGGRIFAAPVADPSRYGVVEFDAGGQVLSVEEKPSRPRSRYAIPGLYVFDAQVSAIAAALSPSARGEVEITAVIEEYRRRGQLRVTILDRGTAWLDTGTFDSLMQASQFVQVIEQRQGIKIACIEEIAYHKGFIDATQLAAMAQPLLKSGYGEYLMNIINQ